jgi:peptidoglycan/LPS O-acetylase OafA/YrhL
MNKQINNNCFDFLRFFFAFNILLAHLWELSQNKTLFILSHFSNSAIAVKGFFVISGFLVAKSYTNTPSLKEYFLKRAKRILPAYIFVVLFATIILSFFSYYSFSEYFNDSNVYQYFGWNIVFLNFLQPCLPGIFENNLICAVNGALWTLKVEEGFYIILPIIFYFILKTKKPLWILITIYLFSIIYWFVLDFYFNQPLLAKQLPGYLAYFSIGMYLFLNFKTLIKNKIIFLFIAVLTIIASSFFDLKINIFYPAAFGITLIILAYSLPFLNKFGKFGDFTYGMYIYHFPIIQLFRQYNLFEKFDPILMAIVAIVITFLFAVFSWFFIEKRFLDRYKLNDKTLIA